MKALLLLGGASALHVLYSALRAVQSGRAARVQGRGPAATMANAAPTHPGVTVIVPAWNDAAVLQLTLAACALELADAPVSTQLLVIAGGPDGTYERALQLITDQKAMHPSLLSEVLRQPPHGKNAALNLGLQAARHDLLVFLDADTVVQPGWLAALTGPLRRGEAGATTGHFSASIQTPVSRVFELQQLANQQLLGPVHLFGGGSIGLDRSTLAVIGGALPANVLVGVDYDLTLRVRQAGVPVAYCPEACVITEISSTWSEFWRGERRWQRAYLDAQTRQLAASFSLGRLVAVSYVPAVYAVLLAGWLALPLAWALVGWPPHQGLLLWLAFAGWTIGRYLCTCLLAHAYDRDARWLQLLPTYAASFVVSAAASWAALLSPRPASAHFKGRRSVPVAE